MRKNLLMFFAVASIALVSCTAEDITSEISEKNGNIPQFTATIADYSTRTSVAVDNNAVKISWSSSDEITVTDASNHTAIYRISSIDESNGRATFEYKSGDALDTQGTYTATYGSAPSTAEAQNYSETGVPLYMTAPETTGTEFTFTAQCGILRIALQDEEHDIKRVKVSSADGKVYTLRCDNVVDIDNSTFFYIALPGGSEDAGIIYNKIKVFDAEGKCAVKDLSALADGGVSIKNNHMKGLNVTSGLYFSLFDEDVDYYFQDPAYPNYWLGGGNDWGTQGSRMPHAHPFRMKCVGDNLYTFDSHCYFNADAHFLGEGLYLDAASYAWTIVKEGEYYCIKKSSGNYLAFNYNDNNVLIARSSPLHLFKWYTAEELLENAVASSGSSDVTFLIKNPEFTRNHFNKDYEPVWTIGGNCTNYNIKGFDGDGDMNWTNYCAESWHSNFDIYQVIDDIPNGKYRLSCQAFYRQDGADLQSFPCLYASGGADERQGNFDIIHYSLLDQNLYRAAENFLNVRSEGIDPGKITIDVTVTNHTLRLGVKNLADTDANRNLWCAWDNFELYYLGQ